MANYFAFLVIIWTEYKSKN